MVNLNGGKEGGGQSRKGEALKEQEERIKERERQWGEIKGREEGEEEFLPFALLTPHQLWVEGVVREGKGGVQ